MLSGVASVSAPANTFSATYKNYLVTCNVSGSAGTVLRMKLRAGGVDTSTNNYFWAAVRSTYASGAYAGFSGNGIAHYEISDLVNSATVVFDNTFSFFRPFDSVTTNIYSQARGDANGAHYASGIFNLTTSFDSFTIFPAAGNITGTLQVYGYNQ
jgi:hypothetical protein